MFQCTATNTLGRDVAFVELRQKGELRTEDQNKCMKGLHLQFRHIDVAICTNTFYYIFGQIHENGAGVKKMTNIRCDLILIQVVSNSGELSGGSLLLSCLLGAGLTISILAAVYCTR